ncbi:MAG TPA: hypothetical protein VNA32_04335 [Actinomycetota bacterium]|nr:hypothetical protein [Actinomycetota bacterium]
MIGYGRPGAAKEGMAMSTMYTCGYAGMNVNCGCDDHRAMAPPGERLAGLWCNRDGALVDNCWDGSEPWTMEFAAAALRAVRS